MQRNDKIGSDLKSWGQVLMDKMRQEMWERAKNRLRQEATENAINGHPFTTVLHEMDLIEQRNLIFGSSNTGDEK